MGVAKLLEFLVGGFAGAEDGTADFFVPGTTDPIIVYRDSAALDPHPADTIDLGASGQLTVYTTTRVRCVLKNADGVAVFDDEPNVDRDRLIDVVSDSFEGQVDGDPVPLSDVLQMPVASFGGTNWRYLAFPGETPMNISDWMTGAHIDARAFGCKGDDAQDNLDQLLRAVDFCSQLGGGVVQLSAGTYRIRDTLVLSGDNVEIRGVNRGVTIIKCMGAGVGIDNRANFTTLRGIRLQASVQFNSGYGITTTGDELRIVSSDVYNWTSGVAINKAGVTTIMDDMVVFYGAGIGAALLGTDIVGVPTGSTLGAGRTEITSCQFAGNNTVSGDAVTSLEGIHIGGTAQNIRITDTFIDKPDYGVVIASTYTGRAVKIRDNYIGAIVAFGAIRCDLTASTDIEQRGNGADRFLKIISGTASYAPDWMSHGLVHKIASDANGTITIGAPTPTPTEFSLATHVHPVLTLHLSVGAGITTSYTWNAIYLRGTALASLAAGHDYIIRFLWDREQQKWVETGVDVT